MAALDWLNGRRTPFADQTLKGAIVGLTLGTTAPKIFRALVEATAFGSRAIVEQFRKEGVPINAVIAQGGIARKSPFVMQVTADILGMPIRVVASDQACALGAGMLAAVAGGVYPDVGAAQKRMGSGFDKTFKPDAGPRCYQAATNGTPSSAEPRALLSAYERYEEERLDRLREEVYKANMNLVGPRPRRLDFRQCLGHRPGNRAHRHQSRAASTTPSLRRRTWSCSTWTGRRWREI